MLLHQLFGEILTKYSESIPMNFNELVCQINSEDNLVMYEKCMALQNEIQTRFQILMDSYTCGKAEYTKIIQGNNN